jgi:hypothetical protein
MGAAGSFEAGTPLFKAISDHGPGTGIDAKIVSQQCGATADVKEVFFRAALLQHLFQSGLLDDWREGSEPAALAFQVGAVFPMEQGVQGFDPANFIERLRFEEP